LIGAVFASLPTPQERVTKILNDKFQLQDSQGFADLSTMCVGGSLSAYINSEIALLPPQEQQGFAQIFQVIAQCFNPMCQLVVSPCWAAFETGLPSDNCVPSFASSPALLQAVCNNGCFTQLESVAINMEQCFQNLAQQNGGASSSTSQFPNFDAVTASSNFMCMTNPADSTQCLTKLAYGTAELLADPADISDPANCPFFSSLGCCATGLGYLLKTFNGTSGGDDECGVYVTPFTYAEYSAALTACGLSDVATCPTLGQSVQLGVVHWVLEHLAFAVYNNTLSAAEKLLFLAALRTDFHTATEINIDLISVGLVTETAIGVDIKIVLRALSDIDTAAAVAAYKAWLIASGAPAFSATTTFASGYAGLTTGGSIQLNSAQSTVGTQSQSGAGGSSSAATVMLSAFAVFAIALTFLFV